MLPTFKVEIGSPSWAQEIRDFTGTFDPLYWMNFTPWTRADIAYCEEQTNRKLPDDFKLFVLEFGTGEFRDPYGGGFERPEDIALTTLGPIWMILGCATWAAGNDQREMYRSRGKTNPFAKYFPESEFIQDGISLFDLLQIGSDGRCNYHQINVSQKDNHFPFGYCLLTEDPTFENKEPSFSAGLSLILSYHEADARGEDVVDLLEYYRTQDAPVNYLGLRSPPLREWRPSEVATLEQWVNQLQSPDATDAYTARVAITKLEKDAAPAVPRLTELLDHEDKAVQREAMLLLSFLNKLGVPLNAKALAAAKLYDEQFQATLGRRPEP